MSNRHPYVSERTKDVQNATLRGVLEAIERERVRQNQPLTLFMNGSWNGELRVLNRVRASTVARAIDELDLEIILINKEGEQV